MMAQSLGVDQVKLMENLKATCFKNASNEEFQTLVIIANQYQLNPFLKELYAFPKKGGGIVPLVGFDGWMKIANRQENFDGMDVEVFGEDKNPTHATCTIHIKDRNHPVVVTEYFSECYRNTDPWNQMPRRMMRNKAIIQAVRVAFGVAGIHDEDEADEIGMRNVTPRHDIDPTVSRLAPPETPPKERKTRQATAAAPPAAAAEAGAVTPADDWITGVYVGKKHTADKDGAIIGWAIRLMLADESAYDCETFSKRVGPQIDALEPDMQIRIKVTQSVGKQPRITELEKL